MEDYDLGEMLSEHLKAHPFNPNDPRFRESHRKDFSDMEWAGEQPSGPPNFKIGDRVEFHVGGFGVIDKVNKPQSGWPASYSTSDIEGKQSNPKAAWHYEGDFKSYEKAFE